MNELSVDVRGTIEVGVDKGDVDRARTLFAKRYSTTVVIRQQGAVPPAIGGRD
jgi:hypothetical protein